MARWHCSLCRSISVFLLALFILLLSLHFVFDAACTGSAGNPQCSSGANSRFLGLGEAPNSVLHLGFLLPISLGITLNVLVFLAFLAGVPLARGWAVPPLTPPPLST